MFARLFRRLRVDTRPFRHRDFRNLWLGQAVSTIGAEIGVVAVPYQVYTLTHSTALVGLLGLASLIPLLVVPLIGGAIADALDRRTVLLRTETGMAVVAALFLGNSLLAHPRVWALFVLQGLAVAIFSLGRPALSSLTPRLVPDDEIAAASALSSVYNSLAAVGGPAVGGVLIAAAGVPWTYGDRPRHLRRVVRRHLAAAEAAAARRGRPAEPELDPRRLPLPERAAGAARDLRGRHERDGLRDADGAVPGARAAPPRRRRVDGRLSLRRAVRRRARLLAGLRLDVARPAAGCRGDDRRVRVGSGDRRLRVHDGALAGARPARGRRRRRLLQRRAAQHDAAARRRPTICAGGSPGSSSRRSRARRTSATSRPACSRRSPRCASRSSRAACSASSAASRRRSRCPGSSSTTAGAEPQA